MVVIKPLYRLAEAGTHWWATYSNYYKIKLAMKTSTYNPYLLISTTDSEGFGVVRI
jgi:N-glycosylase/DNA lyase